ncbi:MAG: HigA family addiction module antitoxin [Terriglobia bacterium]
MANELLNEMHPGRTIQEDVLKPLGLRVNALARKLHVSPTRLNDVVRGRRGITADTALRLAHYLRTSGQFWLNLQSIYELNVAEHEKGGTIKRQVKPRQAA